MKKWLFKLSLVAMTFLLLPVQAVQACCGFIIGRQLTKDGTTLFGRTEDYPYYQNGGKHNGALPTRLTNSSGGWYRSTFVLSHSAKMA